MIGGSNQRKVSSYVPYTGIGAVRVVAVNPSNTEYEKITGKTMPYELDYSVREVTLGETVKMMKAIHFLVHNTEKDIYEFIRFSVTANDDVAKTGSMRFMDSKGNMTYSQDIQRIKDNPKMSWFDADNTCVIKEGMYEIYSFIQCLIKYSSSAEGAQFKKDMDNLGITGEALYRGDLKGLKELVNWCNTENFTVGVLFCVKQKTKDDGETQNIQEILSNPDTFFLTKDGNIPASAYKKLKTLVDKKKEQGYSLTTRLFTYKFQEFNEESCVNNVPAEEETSNFTGWSV